METQYFDGPSKNLPAGTVSEVSWENPIVNEAMRLIFKPRPHEELTEVYATKDGIRAYFKFKPIGSDEGGQDG